MKCFVCSKELETDNDFSNMHECPGCNRKMMKREWRKLKKRFS